MLIGIDLDEVLARFRLGFSNWHNAIYGTNLNLEQVTEYNVTKAMGLERPIVHDRLREFAKTPEFKTVSPVKGAAYGVKKLSEKNELMLITARLKEYKNISLDWVETHIGNFFSDTYFSKGRDVDPTGKNKGLICHNYGIELMIDDSPEYISECYQYGIDTILLTKPWNKGAKLNDKITRADSWYEIVGVL
jgi:uncharacterized HAD superfamily protein